MLIVQSYSRQVYLTGTPSIYFISNYINCRWTLHFQLNRWRTCYLFNKIDGVPVTGIPDGSRTQSWMIFFTTETACMQDIVILSVYIDSK